MSTAKLKTPKTASSKNPVAVKKGIVVKTITNTANAQPKAITVTIIKAKTANAPLAKKEFVEPVKRALSRSVRPVNKQKALSKEDLKKRQQSKGTSRKQGGVKYETLQVQQVKAMANVPEIGPTKVK